MADYELRTESIRSFVDDNKIELPRFQRKLSWSQEENFKLILSVFKGYPIGVVVLTETEGTKYLLDGRQRRNALDSMRNPEEIYDWAKSAIGFLNQDSENSVRKQYWEYVDDYFGRPDIEDGDEEEFGEEASENLENEGDLADLDSEEREPNRNDNDDNQAISESADYTAFQEDEGLRDLLSIIVMVHYKHGRTSGLTRPFDFRDYVEDLNFLVEDHERGQKYIDTEELIKWIDYKSKPGQIPTQDEFYQWLMSRNTPGEGGTSKESTIRGEISRKWDQIEPIFENLEKLYQMLQDRKVGYMMVRDVSANDEKKIFEIINSEGTELTAVEILSAKPAYNIEISDPSEQLVDDKNRLYEQEMGVENKNTVRWDRPATLYDRLNVEYIFPEETSNFEKKVTIGFQVMSGYYLGGVSRNHFEELAYSDDFSWGAIDLEQGMNTMAKKLGSQEILEFWQDWGLSLLKSTSRAVALNYLLVMMKYWDNLGRPTTSGSDNLEKFKQRGIVLLDRSIFEYITGQWRGSSDSRIASNLNDVGGGSEIFEPVDAEDWERLIDEIVDEGQIEGRTYLGTKQPKARIKLLLHYHYVLNDMLAPQNASLDHIIPRSQFETTNKREIKQYEHHIANLSYIPNKENTRKGNDPLNKITNSWLKAQIEEYADIPEDAFENYSKASQVRDLIDYRGPIIKETFKEKRREKLGLI